MQRLPARHSTTFYKKNVFLCFRYCTIATSVPGKIRGIIPYQPAFRKYDMEIHGPVDVEDAANLIPPICHDCEAGVVSAFTGSLLFISVFSGFLDSLLGSTFCNCAIKI